MSKGIKKTGAKPDETKPVDQMTGYEISRALDAQDAERDRSDKVPAVLSKGEVSLDGGQTWETVEDAAERLRVSLRNSTLSPEMQEAIEQDCERELAAVEQAAKDFMDKNPNASDDEIRAAAKAHFEAGFEASVERTKAIALEHGFVPGTGNIQSAASETYQGGLHHGYPPHNPGEGIQGGVATTRRPAIGRIVHFASEAYPDPVPAIITRVHNATLVDLTVFRPPMDPKEQQTTDDEGKRLGKPVSGYKVVQGVPGGIGRRWFWPEY